MLKPTVGCGKLRGGNAGEEVILAGWVSSWRDHGGVVFIDLRDSGGVTQVVFGRSSSPEDPGQGELLKRSHSLRNEYVIAVRGRVERRPEGTENSKIPTGEIEVLVQELEVLNTCAELPFDLKNPGAVGEETLLKYRYLEMRTGKLRENLIFKHRLFQETRNFFSGKGFCEIETPFLTKSTPEGARDFLVPSRINPGSFYALPQSPQLFKQILMVGGMMRYFQIVKCFRDEDLRQDRQPEFTQLDLEMSFIDETDIKNILEEYMGVLFERLLGVELKRPFRSLGYSESMLRFGTDKPDLRNPLEIRDITEIASRSSFKVFKSAAETGVVRGVKVPGADKVSLSDIDRLTGEVAELGAKGLAWMRHKDEGLHSQITKFFSPEILDEIRETFETSPGDLIFFIADSTDTACRCLSYLRDKLYRPDPGKFEILWVEDYPLFEKDDEGGWKPLHHPFTAPCPEDIRLLDSEPGKVRSRAYDLVLNGSEIGGGSIRIHSGELQSRIFNIIGITPEEAESRFGFLLKALKYGAPPHGGFAFGVDRMTAGMMNLSSIRDVIPFPKTQKAHSPLTEAPSPVDRRQVYDLGLEVRVPEKPEKGV